jgi:hypothetical protein
LHVPRDSAAGLGIFDGDNPEARIMMLTKEKISLRRSALIRLVLVMTMTFGGSALLAYAMSLQAASESSNTQEKFAGTWHWMFNGKSFATMILVRSGSSGFTGSVTESRIALNDDGSLMRADPSEDSTPKPISKTSLEGSRLHITVTGGFEFVVNLKDSTHAEIRPVGAPPNMKPIPAQKVH